MHGPREEKHLEERVTFDDNLHDLVTGASGQVRCTGRTPGVAVGPGIDGVISTNEVATDGAALRAARNTDASPRDSLGERTRRGGLDRKSVV